MLRYPFLKEKFWNYQKKVKDFIKCLKIFGGGSIMISRKVRVVLRGDLWKHK